MSTRQAWSVEQVRALGTTTNIPTAGAVLGIGVNKSYALARAGKFPVPVLKTGARYLVPVAHLLRALGVDS